MKLKELIPYLNVNAIEIECGEDKKRLDSATIRSKGLYFEPVFEDYLNAEIVSITTNEAKIVLKI